jgi:hypothetical protein
MPKDMHQKAAEHHEQTAKAHRTAAQQHGSSDHVNVKTAIGSSRGKVEDSKNIPDRLRQRYTRRGQLTVVSAVSVFQRARGRPVERWPFPRTFTPEQPT